MGLQRPFYLFLPICTSAKCPPRNEAMYQITFIKKIIRDMLVANAESLTGVEVVYLNINERSTLRIIQLDLYNVKKQTTYFKTHRLNLLRQQLVTKHF